jgi:uracil-DNA glycosylase
MLLPHPRTGQDYESPVPAGAGWPGDPATEDTVVAKSAAGVRSAARRASTLGDVDAGVSVCRACRRLVRWREDVALAKRRSYENEPYWGRPVPGFGPADARIWLLGLAPAAHGANRTGRVFTGDRSGDFLFAALYRAGLASSPDSVDAADGLALNDTRVVAAVRCAPPDNKPLPEERAACAPWLDAEWGQVGPDVRVIVVLGGFAWRAVFDMLRTAGAAIPVPLPKFGHLATVEIGGVTLLGCYHPSQQNTFTGRLTPDMLDIVFAEAIRISGTSAAPEALHD